MLQKLTAVSASVQLLSVWFKEESLPTMISMSMPNLESPFLSLSTVAWFPKMTIVSKASKPDSRGRLERSSTAWLHAAILLPIGFALWGRESFQCLRFYWKLNSLSLSQNRDVERQSWQITPRADHTLVAKGSDISKIASWVYLHADNLLEK